MDLDELMKTWRKIRKRKSLRSLAREIGVDHVLLHRFDTGRNVLSGNFRKIIQWLEK